jgi:thiol-disulfide isomerase/thioredoxin
VPIRLSEFAETRTYSRRCGHCQTMAKAWSDLAKTVHTKYKGVRVGTVNCDQHRDFCEMFQVAPSPGCQLSVRKLLAATGPRGRRDCDFVSCYAQIRGFPTLLLMKDPEAFEDATPVLFERTVPCYSVRPDPWLYMVPGSYVTSWFHPTASNSGVVNRHSGAEHVPRL